MSSDIQLSSMQDNLDKWLSSTNPTPLHSKQYDVQKKWISDASVPMIEWVKPNRREALQFLTRIPLIDS